MKALLTANYRPDYLARLNAVMAVDRVGFALGQDLLHGEELVKALKGCDIFIVSYDDLSREVIEQAHDLKLIASIRGGPEANIDISAATAAGIPVLYTIGRTEHAVSEYVFTLMLLMARPVYDADCKMRDGSLMNLGEPVLARAHAPALSTAERDIVWPLEPSTPAYQEHQRLFGTELFEKNLGLVGFGNIGRAVTTLATAFGMHVLVHDPYVDRSVVSDAGAESVELMDLMRRSDYISLHARLTQQSAGMIGREQLRAMKPTACLINTARAALVDEAALIEALREGWFRKAALDVHHQEPLPLDHPILQIDRARVIVGPHLAGSTREVEQHHSRLLTETIFAWLEGRQPRALFNPAVLEAPDFARRGALLCGILTKGR